jgi:hypothetical protein
MIFVGLTNSKDVLKHSKLISKNHTQHSNKYQWLNKIQYHKHLKKYGNNMLKICKKYGNDIYTIKIINRFIKKR